MAESVTQKADRYLLEGKVKVIYADLSHGEFEVSGSSKYLVKAIPWTCTCPARVIDCAHVLACQKIASFEEINKIMFVGDDENAKFLQDLLGD